MAGWRSSQEPAGESPFFCGKGPQAFCFVRGLKKSSPYFREYASGFFKPGYPFMRVLHLA